MAYPFSSPPRGSGSTGRNYRQDALVFEDLVPDNMWSNIESGQSDHTKHDNLFPSAFFRWAEETAVLDGSSMHDLILLLKPYLLFSLRKNLEVEIAKRKAAREERRKKEAEKKDKKKEADAQVLILKCPKFGINFVWYCFKCIFSFDIFRLILLWKMTKKKNHKKLQLFKIQSSVLQFQQFQQSLDQCNQQQRHQHQVS